MKRFFLIFALALSAASILVLKLKLSIVLPVILSAVFFVLFLWLRHIKPLIFLKGILCFLALFCASLVFVSSFKAAKHDRVVNFWNGKTATVSGTVCEEPETHGTYSVCYVKCDEIFSKPISETFKFRMTYSSSVKIEAFDRITATAEFHELSNYTSGSDFADGVYIGTYSNDLITESGNRNNPYYRAIKLRNTIRDSFTDHPKISNGNVAVALLTGDKSAFSDSFYSAVKTCGMSHIFAVSGLHISIVCLTAVTFLRKLRLGRKVTAIIGMLTVILMAAVAGFSGSILRAGLMYLLLFSGDLFSRRADTLNSLSFAAVVLMLYNPYNLFGISFLLSAAGTLGIVLFANKMQEFMKSVCPVYGIPRDIFLYVTGVFSVTLSAQVFILPISLCVFGYISVIAPVVNFVLTVPIYLCLLCSLLCILLGFVPYLSNILFKLNDFFCSVLVKVIYWFSENTKYPCFYKSDIFMYIFLLLLVVGIILCFIFSKNKVASLSIITACVILLPLCLTLQAKYDSRVISLNFFSTSSGNSVIIRRGSHVFIIIDPKSNWLPNEITYSLDDHKTESIDAVLVSNTKQLRSGSFKKLKDSYNVKRIITGDKLRNLTVCGLDGVRIDCLNATDNKTDFLITLNNSEKILFNASGQCAQYGDVIFTESPMLSYKIYGDKSAYILANGGNSNKNNTDNDYITLAGAKVARANEDSGITAKKRNNQMLKFGRK